MNTKLQRPTFTLKNDCELVLSAVRSPDIHQRAAGDSIYCKYLSHVLNLQSGPEPTTRAPIVDKKQQQEQKRNAGNK